MSFKAVQQGIEKKEGYGADRAAAIAAAVGRKKLGKQEMERRAQVGRRKALAKR